MKQFCAKKSIGNGIKSIPNELSRLFMLTTFMHSWCLVLLVQKRVRIRKWYNWSDRHPMNSFWVKKWSGVFYHQIEGGVLSAPIRSRVGSPLKGGTPGEDKIFSSWLQIFLLWFLTGFSIWLFCKFPGSFIYQANITKYLVNLLL